LAASSASADAASGADHGGDVHEVGRIVGAWGVKGWIKIEPYADDPAALLGARRWMVSGEAASHAQPPARPLTIVDARRHGEFVLAQAEGISDRDGADALRGLRVCVPRSAFPKPPTDAYYWVDLIGSSVANREGAALGTVVGLIETGAHAVLRVRAGEEGADAVERLIPFVDAYVDEVDLAHRVVRVDWGLDY